MLLSRYASNVFLQLKYKFSLRARRRDGRVSVTHALHNEPSALNMYFRIPNKTFSGSLPQTR